MKRRYWLPLALAFSFPALLHAQIKIMVQLPTKTKLAFDKYVETAEKGMDGTARFYPKSAGDVELVPVGGSPSTSPAASSTTGPERC